LTATMLCLHYLGCFTCAFLEAGFDVLQKHPCCYYVFAGCFQTAHLLYVEFIHTRDMCIHAFAHMLMDCTHKSDTESTYVITGFEVVHGLLDHVMTLLDVKLDTKDGYSLVPASGADMYVHVRSCVHMCLTCRYLSACTSLRHVCRLMGISFLAHKFLVYFWKAWPVVPSCSSNQKLRVETQLRAHVSMHAYTQCKRTLCKLLFIATGIKID